MKEKYVKALESVSDPIIVDNYSLDGWKSKAINIVSDIYGKDSNQVNQIEKVRFIRYTRGYVSGTRDGKSKHFGGGNNSTQCSKFAKGLILGIIDHIKLFGIPEIESSKSDSALVAITNNQSNDQSVSQSQSVKVDISFIWESFKDELGESKLDELKEIASGSSLPLAISFNSSNLLSPNSSLKLSHIKLMSTLTDWLYMGKF